MKKVIFFFVIILLISCEKDIDSPTIKEPYLKIEGDIESSKILLKKENQKNYLLAIQRIKDYSIISKKGEINISVASGQDINISQRLFNRIKKHVEILNEQINNEILIYNSATRKYYSPILKLKNGPGTPGKEGALLSLSGNIGLSLVNGWGRSYSGGFNNIGEIWNLASGNFSASNFYMMSGQFTMGGFLYTYQINNACEAGSQNNPNNCELNDILDTYIKTFSSGRSEFIINNIWGLPLVTISVNGGGGRDFLIDATGMYRTD